MRSGTLRLDCNRVGFSAWLYVTVVINCVFRRCVPRLFGGGGLLNPPGALSSASAMTTLSVTTIAHARGLFPLRT